MKDYWTPFRRGVIALVLGAALALGLTQTLVLSLPALGRAVPAVGSWASRLGKECGDLDCGFWQTIFSLLSPTNSTVPELVPPLLFALLLSATALLVWYKAAPTIDLLFLAPFDRWNLAPVGWKTGLLRWTTPADGSPQLAVWESLESWVTDGAGDGRWRSFWRRPKLPIAFGYALLLGGNGVGKTQLAREFARQLARRDRFGSHCETRRWRAALGNGLARAKHRLRLLFWCRPRRDLPWDAGLLEAETAEELLARLGNWRPRRPTLLLLDEPTPAMVACVVAQLRKAAPSFWHPVRLLLIDQAIPGALELSYGGGQWMESAGNRDRPLTVPVFDLGEVGFAERELRAINAAGFCVEPPPAPAPAPEQPETAPRQSVPGRGGQAPSPAVGGHDLTARLVEHGAHDKRLFAAADLQRLVKLTDGNPLVIALARLWLMEDDAETGQRWSAKKISDLGTVDLTRAESSAEFQQVRDKVLHRLLKQRVDDLILTLERRGLKENVPVVKALGCASLAGSIPLAAARKAFGDTLSSGVLQEWFPHRVEAIRRGHFPGITPRLVAAAFIEQKVLPAYRDELAPETDDPDLAAARHLVADAWRLNPEGMEQAVLRHGARDDLIGRALLSLTEDRPELRAGLALALAEAAVLRGSRVLPALRAAETLDPAQAAAVLQSLSGWLDRPKSNTLAALSLSLHLLARRAGGEIGAADFGQDCAFIARWLPWANRSPWLPPDGGEALFAGLSAWLKALHLDDRALAADSPTARRLHEIWADLSRDWITDTTLRLPIARALAGCRPASDCGRIWSLWETALREGSAAAAALADGLLAGPPGPFADPALRARAVALVFDGRIDWPLAGLQRDLLIRVTQSERTQPAAAANLAGAWRRVANECAQRSEPEPAREAAERVGDLAAPIAPDDGMFSRIQRERAAAWGSVAVAHADRSEPEPARKAAERVDDLAVPIAPDDPLFSSMQRERAAAWRNVAVANANRSEPEPAREAAERVDALAAPIAPDDAMFSRVQNNRAAAWCSVAAAHAARSEPEPAREAAERVDALAAPIAPDDVMFSWMQRDRAAAWGSVALAHAARSEPGPARKAADRVDALAAPIAPDDVMFSWMQRDRAAAWGSVALAHANRSEPEPAREAAERVDTLAAPIAPDDVMFSWMQHERAAAWRSVALAHANRSEPGPAREAAERVDALAATVPKGDVKFEDLRDECRRAWSAVVEAYERVGNRAQAAWARGRLPKD